MAQQKKFSDIDDCIYCIDKLRQILKYTEIVNIGPGQKMKLQ